MMLASLREYLVLWLLLLTVEVHARPSRHHHHTHVRLIHHERRASTRSGRRSLPALGSSSLPLERREGAAAVEPPPPGFLAMMAETPQDMVGVVRDMSADAAPANTPAADSGALAPAAGEACVGCQEAQDTPARKKIVRLEDLRRRSKPGASEAFHQLFHARKKKGRRSGHNLGHHGHTHTPL